MNVILEVLQTESADLVFFEVFLESGYLFCCDFDFDCFGFFLFCHFMFSFVLCRFVLRIPVLIHVTTSYDGNDCRGGFPVLRPVYFESQDGKLFQESQIGFLVHEDDVSFRAFDTCDFILNFFHHWLSFSQRGRR